MGETIVKSACRMCHGICGVLVHMENGRITKVTGDKECPTSEGYICPKGKASVELLYHPDRLKFPLKRAGARGENKWQRISWDEALDTTAQKLLEVRREFGAESIVGAQGTGRPYLIFFRRFLYNLGTPNWLAYGHLCYSPKVRVAEMTCGQLPVCDYYGFGGVYPSCVVVWGCNLTGIGASDGMCGYQLTRTLKKGARLIVIDPRLTPLAEKADIHLQLRPGTDGALAMGMLNVIIRENLYDKIFVDRWTVGFEELAKRAAEYPPEKVAEITWVPAQAIIEAARVYATTPPACIQTGVAIEQNINCMQTIRAILVLAGITGNIDVPGGDAFWVPPEKLVQQNPSINPSIIALEKLTPEVRKKKIGADVYRLTGQVQPNVMFDTAISGKPYPLKALFIMGRNMLVSDTDSAKAAKALKNIDFIVTSDMFMTPTTQMADIIFPAASWLEVDDVADIHFVWTALVRQKVATIGECRDDKDLIIGLAHRMGMQDAFPWQSGREYCEWILKDSGITFEEFKKIGIISGKMRYRKYEQQGFRTPSGKFELYCADFKKNGYDPLPFYAEPPESPYSTPEVARQYPLIITSGARNIAFFHSEGRQIPSLRKLNPDPLLEIHPDTARKLGIADGDWVWIENARGRVKQRARLTDGIDPRVVNAQHAWWFPEKEPPEYGYKESSINFLTGGMACDPHGGAENLRSFLCKVYKA